MYIRDNETGKVRLYGTNCHDSLEISDDGRYLYYCNLQNGEGSRFGGYSFITDEKGRVPQDDEGCIKHGAEAYFNIGGFGKDLKSENDFLYWFLNRYFVEEWIKEVGHG